MRGFRWIALQGSSRGLLPPLLLFCFITTSGIPAHAADDPTACRTPVARVVSIQGSIEVLRAPQNDWIKVTRLDTPLCEGDRLRTGVLSRAALFIQTETLVRVDQNTSISVSQTADETLVEFTQEEVLPAAAGAYTCGAGYFITRFPRKFRVKTPHLNAAVEGTEFLVAMRCESTELSVFEGKVLAAGAGANVSPAQSISSGQVLSIGGSEPPTVKLLVKPTDAVQWVLYYAPLSDATAEAELPSADQCRSLPKPLDQTCLTQRAETLLRLGRVDDAQREADEAAALDSGRGDANELRAIISIARNDKAGAMEAATAATTASPNSSRTWLALSYAQQASFKLDDSLASALKAQALEPSSSVINARLAELLMSLGRIKEAEVAARAAVDANASESRARTVLGFVHLAQINTKAARDDFETAIERDSSDPLPRLGLGLAIIRDGKLVDGREQLEIAVALDPTNSLLRSYVGKAYYEENSKERDQLAARQFDLAKTLDPNDPTPWFYSAILRQSMNVPLEAMADSRESTDLNSGRAVYRSKLLLDEDAAARRTLSARLEQEIGFSQRAVVEATQATVSDPGSYATHRLLADAYVDLPRHEVARQSELLQAQIRQPLARVPLQPQVTEDSFIALRGAGPASPGWNEFNPLFVQDGADIQVSGLLGSNNTHGDQVLMTGLKDRWSFSFAQLAYDTDGFRENDDFHNDVYNALVHHAFNESTSAQIELKSSRTERGDSVLRFDPATFFSFRDEVKSESVRLGARHRITPSSDLLVSLIHVESEENVTFPPTPDLFAQEIDTSVAEVQYATKADLTAVIMGAGYTAEQRQINEFGSPSESDPEGRNAYVYATWRFPLPALALQLGVSGDDLDAPDPIGDDRQQINPKFGLVWDFAPSTTLRAASTRVLKRKWFAGQTLEPSQVAGFNQFFDDMDGTDSTRQGIGIDHRVSRQFFTGIEVTRRSLRVPQEGTNEVFNWYERLNRAYLNWAPTDRVSLTAGYVYERFDRPESFPGQELIVQAITERIPLGINFFSATGISAQVLVTHVDQEGLFFSFATGPTPFAGSSRFWNTDLNMSYRLPRRRGLLSFDIRNLFDESFQFQETDLTTTTFAPERSYFARLVLNF